MAWAPNEVRDTAEIRAYGATFATDKIEDKRYFQTYLKIAADLGPRASVCELGVWQGESLRMWQALFPLARSVTGIDYQTEDRVWPEGTVQVISAAVATGRAGGILRGGRLVYERAACVGAGSDAPAGRPRRPRRRV